MFNRLSPRSYLFIAELHFPQTWFFHLPSQIAQTFSTVLLTPYHSRDSPAINQFLSDPKHLDSPAILRGPSVTLYRTGALRSGWGARIPAGPSTSWVSVPKAPFPANFILYLYSAVTGFDWPLNLSLQECTHCSHWSTHLYGLGLGGGRLATRRSAISAASLLPKP